MGLPRYQWSMLPRKLPLGNATGKMMSWYLSARDLKPLDRVALKERGVGGKGGGKLLAINREYE